MSLRPTHKDHRTREAELELTAGFSAGKVPIVSDEGGTALSMTFTICERVTLGDGREVWSHGECDATFNVHNPGGVALLRSIGLEPEPCGSHEAADVLARCAVWRAVDAPARGIVEPSDTRGAAGARVVECGVGADYVAVRVGWLEELARIAVASGPGVAVGWA